MLFATVVYAKKELENQALQGEVEELEGTVDCLAELNLDKEELIREKDARHAEVCAENLRLGGSKGAEDLVELREFYRRNSFGND